MAEQYYFEATKIERCTDYPRRIRALLLKRRALDLAREQVKLQNKQRTVMQLRTMIPNLEWEVAHLNDSIRSELELARVRDPTHFGYPISVRTMAARRDNLKNTIAALSDRLAMMDDFSTR